MTLDARQITELNGRKPSGHTRNLDHTIEDEARAFAVSIMRSLDDGEVDEEFDYGTTTRRCEVHTLAGGGPGAELYVTYDSDGDVDEMILVYFEGSGSSAVLIPPWYAEKIDAALKQEATG